MQPFRIHHVGLLVSYLDLSVAWYREPLGLSHESTAVCPGVLPSSSRRPASGSKCSQRMFNPLPAFWIPRNHRTEGAAVVAALRRLGYRVQPKALDFGDYIRIGDSRLKVQAGVHTQLTDYPAAAYLNTLFSCASFRPATPANVNASAFCDPQIDRRIRPARAREITDPALASALWSEIDDDLVDQAPVVPLANPKQIDLVSPRVGNYQYNPQWGVLVDQLWVR